MTYRFYITIGSSQVEVHPLNFLKTSIQYTIDDDVIFYRRKFNGTLRFIGDDYDILYMVEQIDRCTELILTIEQRDSGAATWHEYWVGYFSTTDGNFDLDNCFFEVTPKPYDDYKIFDEKGDDEFNLFSVAAAPAQNTNTTVFDRGRWLMDLIRYIANEISTGITVQSYFFELDTSYITNTDNVYRYVTIFQKSDVKRPASSNPATVAKISFNELMQILRQYNVWWKIIDDTLVVEHYDYFTSFAGMDLRTQSLSLRSNKYSYIKDKMPKYEKFSHMEAGNVNFLRGVISYDDGCVNNDPKSNSIEYANRVTTDLDFITESVANTDGGNISDEGFVLLASYLEDATYWIYFGTAFDSDISTYNHVHSWSYMLRMLHLHNRVVMNGYINGVAYDFISARKTKLQNINAVVCYEDNFDPEEYITTELGEEWFDGEKGYVREASLKPTGEMSLSLLYGPDKNTDVVLPEPPKVIHIIYTSDTIWFEFSEVNVYDSIFYVWINDATCQTINIPAGTQFYTTGLNDTAPPIAFNFNDPSLTGWNFILNDGEGIVYADPGDCGVAPVVPDIPDTPTSFNASQAGDCDPVVLTWDAMADATFYRIYRYPNPSGGSGYGIIKTVFTNTWSDTLSGLVDGQLFFYRVYACNIAGCSDHATTSITTSCP